MDTPPPNGDTGNPHPQPTISIDKGVGDDIVANNNNIINIQNGDRKIYFPGLKTTLTQPMSISKSVSQI